MDEYFKKNNIVSSDIADTGSDILQDPKIDYWMFLRYFIYFALMVLSYCGVVSYLSNCYEIFSSLLDSISCIMASRNFLCRFLGVIWSFVHAPWTRLQVQHKTLFHNIWSPWQHGSYSHNLELLIRFKELIELS